MIVPWQIFHRCTHLQCVAVAIRLGPLACTDNRPWRARLRNYDLWSYFAGFVSTVPSTIETLAVEIRIDIHPTVSTYDLAQRSMSVLQGALTKKFGTVLPRILVHPPVGEQFTEEEKDALPPLFPPGTVCFEQPAWLWV